MKLKKIVVANRGDIACRIFSTLKRLNMASVAIYSTMDTHAKHTQMADEAYHIDESSGSNSYLNIDAILSIAKRTHCDGLHPGYGFLSENAKLAKACKKAGITFIGPSPTILQKMGDKATARQWADKMGIPIIPGYDATDQSTNTLLKVIRTIGCPVLIKPALGGGGKGMSLAHTIEEATHYIESAKRQALNHFEDDRLIIEKYCPKARHIEVQIFGDSQGNVVHLFERECSIQRHYQKIIEESPAPQLKTQLRSDLLAAAKKLGKALHYVGAGTVEFLVTASGFYFMEMNTRLQVEHAVTEMTTQQDLVEWQLRIASGESLPLQQDQIIQHGHAIEARLYAENPCQHFMPQTGKIQYWQTPKTSSQLRIDTGLQLNDTVGTHYDALLAKVIAHGTERTQAIQTLVHALKHIHLIGVMHNGLYLQPILQSPDFEAGHLHTQLTQQFLTEQIAALYTPSKPVILMTALSILLHEKKQVSQAFYQLNEPDSPWALCDAWQLSMTSPGIPLNFYLFDSIDVNTAQASTHPEFHVTIRPNADHYIVSLNPIKSDQPNSHISDFTATGQWLNAQTFTATINDQKYQAIIIEDNGLLHVSYHGHTYRFKQGVIPPALALSQTDQYDYLHSPMPGTVIQINVKPSDTVKRGDVLMIIEAMKMEYTLQAPQDSCIKTVYFNVGDQVKENEKLLDLKPKKEK